MDEAELETTLDAQLRLGVAALKAGNIPSAIDLLSPVALQARAADLPGLEASACGMLAQAFPLAGQLDQALPHARRALEIAETLGDPGATDHFRKVVATLMRDGSDPDDFDAQVRGALKQAQDGDPLGATRVLIQLAAWAKQAEALGPEASARILLGQILLANEQRELAVSELDRAIAIAEQLGDAATATRIRDLLAGGEGA